MQELLERQWSVVGGRWVGRGPFVESVVGELVEHLPMAR